MSSNAAAERAFSRVMASQGGARIQGLVKISRIHPDYAPIWAALAEEHFRSRRREEAIQAARRAIKLDPRTHRGFSSDLKMATRSILAQIAPDEARGKKPNPAPQSASALSPPGVQSNQMLKSALALHDPNERISVLEELHAIAPNDAEVLFHLAKELATADRSDDARNAGEELRKLSPDLYTELYSWATQHLAEARARVQAQEPAAAAPSSQTPPPANVGYSSGRPRHEGTGRPAFRQESTQEMPQRGIPNPALRAGGSSSYPSQPQPGQPPEAPRARVQPQSRSQPQPQPRIQPRRTPAAAPSSGSHRRPPQRAPSRTDSRTGPPRIPLANTGGRGGSHQGRGRGVNLDDLDEPVTFDKTLGNPVAVDVPDDDEVTNRSLVSDLLGYAQPPDDENATRQVDLREMERLASASMDPALDD